MSRLPDDLAHVSNAAAAAVPSEPMPGAGFHQTFRYCVRETPCLCRMYWVAKAAELARSVGRPDVVRVADWHRDRFLTGLAEIDVPYATAVVLGDPPDPCVVAGIRAYGKFRRVVVDGNHRLYRAWLSGRATYPALVLSDEEIERCRLTPDELAAGGLVGPGWE